MILTDPQLEATFLDALAALVNVESPSRDSAATSRCVDETARVGAALLGEPAERVEADGCSHLRWRFGREPRVLLLGHVDTVWPAGTLQRWPFTVADGIASGPGVFDMKSGVVVALMCTAALPDRDGVEILLNSDEETGSPSSGPLIREAATRAGTVLVFEAASKDGALKTARKGVSRYSISTRGRAAHPGFERAARLNAISTLCEVIVELGDIAHAAGRGTTVIPTMIRGGTAPNTVPAAASVTVDVRATSRAAQQAVHAALHELSGDRRGVGIDVVGSPTRPPLPPDRSDDLFAMYVAIARQFHHDVTGMAVGGASDGNLCADEGALTLDGLGAIGGHAHAEGEYVDIARTLSRMRVTCAFMERLLSDGVAQTS